MAVLFGSDNFSPNSFNCFSVWKIIESAELIFSISSRAALSASSFALASSRIRWISASDKPDEPSILMRCSLPVPRSLAVTFKIPFASTSKVTSTCGTPLGAGGMPSKWKRPKSLLSLAIWRSPCKTWISTLGWLSAAVEKVSDFFEGIVVLASIILVNTPPRVSIPNDNGITSNNRISFTSPVKTPPWIAAPNATASSGFTPFEGFLPKNFSTSSCTFGIRVDPPTKITSSI